MLYAENLADAHHIMQRARFSGDNMYANHNVRETRTRFLPDKLHSHVRHRNHEKLFLIFSSADLNLLPSLSVDSAELADIE